MMKSKKKKKKNKGSGHRVAIQDGGKENPKICPVPIEKARALRFSSRKRKKNGQDRIPVWLRGLKCRQKTGRGSGVELVKYI